MSIVNELRGPEGNFIGNLHVARGAELHIFCKYYRGCCTVAQCTPGHACSPSLAALLSRTVPSAECALSLLGGPSGVKPVTTGGGGSHASGSASLSRPLAFTVRVLPLLISSTESSLIDACILQAKVAGVAGAAPSPQGVARRGGRAASLVVTMATRRRRLAASMGVNQLGRF